MYTYKVFLPHIRCWQTQQTHVHTESPLFWWQLMVSMVFLTIWSNFDSTKQAVLYRRKVLQLSVLLKFIFHQTKTLLAIKTHVDEIRYPSLNVLSFINKNSYFISYCICKYVNNYLIYFIFFWFFKKKSEWTLKKKRNPTYMQIQVIKRNLIK